MSLKSRFFFSFSFSVLLAMGLGGTLLFGIYQGQALYDSINRSFQVRQTVLEADYFFQRYGQILEYFVMFQDDAEKMYLFQTQRSLVEKLNDWEKLADQGWGPKADLADVKINCQRLFYLRFQILNLVEGGRRPEAIVMVQREYLPISSQTEEKIRLATRRLDDDSSQMAEEAAAVIGRSRTLFKYGVGFSILLFLVFIRDIRRSMVLPAKTVIRKPR